MLGANPLTAYMLLEDIILTGAVIILFGYIGWILLVALDFFKDIDK